MENTVLFEHRCYSCPLALVALNAEEQEKEREEEIEDQRIRQLECESSREFRMLRLECMGNTSVHVAISTTSYCSTVNCCVSVLKLFFLGGVFFFLL